MHFDRAFQLHCLNEMLKHKKRQETLTNIILNIQMASIVITDGEIKFTSSDMSMTGNSIG